MRFSGKIPAGRPFRQAVVLFAFALATALGAAAQDPTASPVPSAAPSAAPAKQKKVWTSDDFRSAAPAADNKPSAAGPGTSAAANAKLAEQLRTRLRKLEAQLENTRKELNDLKNFEAGEGNGNAGRQLHKGYSTEPIPEQMQKLEAKKQQLEEQIDALYDEARKDGILPGQLR